MVFVTNKKALLASIKYFFENIISNANTNQIVNEYYEWLESEYSATLEHKNSYTLIFTDDKKASYFILKFS